MPKMNKPLLPIVVSLIAIVTLSRVSLIYINASTQRIQVDIIPDRLNTISGDVGWFIVDFTAPRGLTDPTSETHTNASTETEYTYWPRTHLIEVFLYPNSTHLEICTEVELVLSSGSQVASYSALSYVWNCSPSVFV